MTRALAIAAFAALAQVAVVPRVEASEAPEPPPPIVQVYVAGQPAAVAQTRAAVQEICGRANVAVVVRDAADADEALLARAGVPGARLRAYVDMRRVDAPRIVVVDGVTHEDLARRTIEDSTSLETAVEAVAHVLCMAVEASLTPEPAVREEPPRSVPPLAAAAVPPPAAAPDARRDETRETPGAARGVEGEASAFAAMTSFGASHPLLGGGAALEVGVRDGARRIGGLAAVSGYLPATVRRLDGEAEVSAVAVRLAPVFEWRLSGALSVAAGAGGGVDVITVMAQVPPPGAVARDAGADVDPIATALAALRVDLGGRFRATAGAFCDVDLAPHRYVALSSAGAATFFEAARVRGGAALGLSVLLGGGAEQGAAPR